MWKLIKNTTKQKEEKEQTQTQEIIEIDEITELNENEEKENTFNSSIEIISNAIITTHLIQTKSLSNSLQVSNEFGNYFENHEEVFYLLDHDKSKQTIYLQHVRDEVEIQLKYIGKNPPTPSDSDYEEF
jgi:predicted GH43/DUF377 family glycosyl hydrolase